MPALSLSLGLPFLRSAAGGSVPQTPTNFFSVAGDQENTLNWDAQGDALYFVMWFSLTNDFGTAIEVGESIAGGATSFSHTPSSVEPLQRGEKYYYWLTAVNDAGQSGPTNSATARSYVVLFNGNTINLIVPGGSSMTLGNLLFGTTQPPPSGVYVNAGGEEYAPVGGGAWENINTGDPSTSVLISGAFTVGNSTGSSYTFWNAEP